MTDAAFYCVADDRFFLGAAGMINSLRLQGHTEPIYLLDLGLAGWQRDALAAEVTMVPTSEEIPPHLSKTIAPLAHPAETMVLIDSDMILTRSLLPLLETAADGKLVAFRDRQQRFFPEWGEVLGPAKARPGPYLSSGLVLLSGAQGRELLRLLAEAQDRVDYSRTYWRGNDREYPFLYADQDVLNAIVATRLDPDRVVALDGRLAATPPFRRLRLVDVATLRCEFDNGTVPYVLHQFVRKPWLEPMYHGIYSRFLARLLLADDVPVRVPPDAVPRRMREGARARAERTVVNVRDLGRFYLGDLLPTWIGNRLEDRRRRRERAGAGAP
jgi:hypothetical protein